MREILYKVWDVKEKCWIANGEIMDLVYSAKVGCFMFDNDQYDLARKELELVQFTGLKDRNEVKIFEGDIVRETCQDFPVGSYESIWKVEELPEFYGHRFDACVGFGRNNVEVIGNVFEHPHLLNKES